MPWLTPTRRRPATRFTCPRKAWTAVNTLAMNYTALFQPIKKLQVAAKYMHYGYDNQTPRLLVRPVVADTLFLVNGSFHGSTANCFDPSMTQRKPAQ